MPFQYQSRQQQKYAEELAKADAPMNQQTTLRGPQNTSELGMPQDVGSKAMQTAITRSAMGIEQGLSRPQDKGQAVFNEQFGAFQKEQQLKRMMERLDVPYTPLQTPVPQVTPAERARDSEAQRMAQQYGGNDMRLAIMDAAQGKTPEDLVKYYQAQRSAGQDETMKQGMIQYFSKQKGFADSQFGGDKAAQMFVEQNPDVAFREFNKNVPLEVISKGDEQSLRTSPSTEQFGDGEGGMDMSIDMNKAAVMRSYNQNNAFGPLSEAAYPQSLKTDLTGVAGQPNVDAEKPRMVASPFAKANKPAFDLLGIESTFAEDSLGEEQLSRLKRRLDSIKQSGSFLVE